MWKASCGPALTSRWAALSHFPIPPSPRQFHGVEQWVQSAGRRAPCLLQLLVLYDDQAEWRPRCGLTVTLPGLRSIQCPERKLAGAPDVTSPSCHLCRPPMRLRWPVLVCSLPGVRAVVPYLKGSACICKPKLPRNQLSLMCKNQPTNQTDGGG